MGKLLKQIADLTKGQNLIFSFPSKQNIQKLNLNTLSDLQGFILGLFFSKTEIVVKWLRNYKGKLLFLIRSSYINIEIIEFFIYLMHFKYFAITVVTKSGEIYGN